jgi:hypothetical protein
MGMTQPTAGSAAVNGFDVATQMDRVSPPVLRASFRVHGVLRVLCCACCGAARAARAELGCPVRV